MSDITSARNQRFETVEFETWKQEAEKSLKGASFDKRLVSQTLDGIRVDPLYLQSSTPSGFPGVSDFTRGARALPRTDEAWEIRQDFAHPDAKSSNEQMLRDLERGVSGIGVVLDRGFSSGIDEASSCGTPIRSLDDVRSLLEGVHLNMVRVAFNPGVNAHSIAALLAEYVAGSKTTLADLSGTLGYDPYGQLLREGSMSLGREAIFDLGADLASWCRTHAPQLRAIRVDARRYSELGGSEAQELAWGLAEGIEWMRELMARGLSADDAARSLEFSFAAGRDIFIELARLRSARQLWARALEAIGVSEELRAMEMHVRSATATLSRRDPWVNMLRVTGHCFSAALAGASSITTAAYDEALAISIEFGRRIARNTQLILRDESHLGKVLDPAGGSYYLESLTEAYRDKAWAGMQAVEAAGGLLRFITSGTLNSETQAVMSEREKRIARRKMPLTGVSEFPNLHEKPIDTPVASPVAPQRGQTGAPATSGALKAGVFDGSVVEAARKDIAGRALSSAILCALFGMEGELTAPAMRPVRYSASWEAMRDASDAHVAAGNARPEVFLANLGRIPEHRARAMFAQNLLQAGGIEAPNNDGAESIAELVEAFRSSGAPAACICSTDARYAESAAELARALKAAGAQRVLLAGRPGELEDALREAGVDGFMFVGCDALSVVRASAQALGVSIDGTNA